jgi:hypothetical protein
MTKEVARYGSGNYTPEPGDSYPVDFNNPELKIKREDGTFLEVLPRVRWKSPYVFGDTYENMDQVQDSGWLMVANKKTTQRAAPQSTGVDYTEPDPNDPNWVEQSPAGTFVASGTVYTNISAPFYLSEFLVYLHAGAPDTYYKLEARLEYPTGAVIQIESDVLDWSTGTAGWYSIPFETQVLTKGSNLTLVLIHEDRASTLTATAGYSYTSSNVDDIPQATQAHRRNNRTYVDFNVTPLSGAVDLSLIVAGSRISTLSSDWLVESVLLSNEPDGAGGFYYRFDISGAGNPGDGDTTFEFTYPTGTPPQEYYENLNYLAGNPDAQGYLNLSGTVTLSDNAYGVAATVTPITVSSDWDIQSMPNTLSTEPSLIRSLRDISWVEENSESFTKHYVSTTDITWTDANTITLLPGESFSGRVKIYGKRTDATDFFSAELAFHTYYDAGSVSAYEALFELGPALLSARVTSVGDDTVFQVRGAPAQDWDWEVIVFRREL